MVLILRLFVSSKSLLQDRTPGLMFLEHFLCRFNETERLLKELQTAHVLLTKQSDTLKKTHDALQQQHHR